MPLHVRLGAPHAFRAMKDDRTGRKTSPGFADPHMPIRVGGIARQASVPPAQPINAPHPSTVTPATATPAITATPVRAIATPVSSEALPTATPSSNRPRSRRPLIEVDVVRERGRVPHHDPTQGCYEIWTQNTVYFVDARMRCVQVRDLSSGTAKPDHPFLGARLVGGQMQEPSMEMSQPLPRPGSCAVFDLRKNNRRQFTRTSAVERIVLRIHIVTIVDGSEIPAWDDIVDNDE
jgi:hypothetical protein